MTSRRFPYASIAVIALSAVGLAVSGTISGRYCAFGFGGFQCNSPFTGHGGTLLAAVAVSVAALAAAGAVFLWRFVRWLRAARIR